MNTGQTMLTIGSMILLTFLILRFNSIQLTTAETAYNAKFGIIAISLANSLIEEAKDKVFDEAVLDTTKTIYYATDFSSVLRSETGEVYPNFDDFDDYNGPDGEGFFYLDTLSLRNPQTGVYTRFEIRSNVEYVSDTNPNVKSSINTYHKKLNVSVFSDAMIDTVKISTVFSYWTLLE